MFIIIIITYPIMAINIDEFILDNEYDIIEKNIYNLDGCTEGTFTEGTFTEGTFTDGCDYEENEDNEDDEFNDIIHDEYEKKLNMNNGSEGDRGKGDRGEGDRGEGGKDSGEGGGCSVYYFNLLNMFIKYYNDKYDKNEHFFSSIKDNNKDTSTQMEMFYEMIIEYNTLKKNTVTKGAEGAEGAEGSDDTESIVGNVYKEGDSKICDLLNDSKYEQVYCLEINEDNKKIITISLLICLNYVLINKID